MTTKNKKIKYGNVEIDADEFDKKYAKVRVTMMVDLDVVDAFRAEANKRHIGYQTLMNQKLRESISGEDSLEQRLKALEKIVLKKMA
jgi:uncharacterized protein (DUF4415 family)